MVIGVQHRPNICPDIIKIEILIAYSSYNINNKQLTMLTLPTGQTIHIPLKTQIRHLHQYIKTTYDLDIIFKIKWLNLKLENFYEVTNFKVTDDEQGLKIFEIFNECVDNIEDKEQKFKDGEIYFKKPKLYVEFYKSEHIKDNFRDECIVPPIYKKSEDVGYDFVKHELFEINNKLILPLYQGEAITLGITNKNGHSKATKDVALKIYHNDVNIFNNAHYDNDKGITTQNYIYCPRQVWVDGYNNNMKSKQTLHDSVIQHINQFVGKIIQRNIIYDDDLIDEHIGHQLKFEAYMQYNKKFRCYNFTQKKFLDISDIADVGDELIFYEKKNTNTEDAFDLTLYDYGARDTDVLEIINIDIVGCVFVKGLVAGKTYTFHYDNNTTVKNLKYMIQKKLGMPIVDQRLIFSGKQFEDNKLLSHYVTKYDTIQLLGRLVGAEGRGVVKNIGEHNNMYGLCHNIWLDQKFQHWNVKTYDTFTINILNEMQFGRKMPLKTSHIQKYPGHVFVNDKQILLLKHKIASLKYIMFKTSLKSVLCNDVLNIIFGLLSNLYLFK